MGEGEEDELRHVVRSNPPLTYASSGHPILCLYFMELLRPCCALPQISIGGWGCDGAYTRKWEKRTVIMVVDPCRSALHCRVLPLAARAAGLLRDAPAAPPLNTLPARR